MKNYSKITPEGTKDYLALESRAIRCAEKRLSSVFKSKGYEKVMTPTIEFFDGSIVKAQVIIQRTYIVLLILTVDYLYFDLIQHFLLRDLCQHAFKMLVYHFVFITIKMFL